MTFAERNDPLEEDLLDYVERSDVAEGGAAEGQGEPGARALETGEPLVPPEEEPPSWEASDLDARLAQEVPEGPGPAPDDSVDVVMPGGDQAPDREAQEIGTAVPGDRSSAEERAMRIEDETDVIEDPEVIEYGDVDS